MSRPITFDRVMRWVLVGLNPTIILLSLSVWGTLLGLLGMIIALPPHNPQLSRRNKRTHKTE